MTGSSDRLDRHVTVAVRDTSRDRMALGWAAAEAVCRRLPLRVVHAYEWHPGRIWVPRLRPVPESLLQEMCSTAKAELAVAVTECRSAEAEIKVDGAATEGPTSDILVAESRTADLLVLGQSSRPRQRIGTVVESVAERSSCPVVVVPGHSTAARWARVVVGLDLRRDSHSSLAFGFEHAQRQLTTLEAVTCWLPTLMESESLLEPVVAADQANVEEQLCEELLPWRRKYPEVDVVATVLEHRPVTGLLEQSEGCGLLVLGRPGSHPLRAPLGSVHLAALRRADCPVALVPDGRSG